MTGAGSVDRGYFYTSICAHEIVLDAVVLA